MANVLCNVLLDTAFVGGRKNSCVALTPKYEDECIWIPNWKSKYIVFGLKFVELFQSIVLLCQLC